MAQLLENRQHGVVVLFVITILYKSIMITAQTTSAATVITDLETAPFRSTDTSFTTVLSTTGASTQVNTDIGETVLITETVDPSAPTVAPETPDPSAPTETPEVPDPSTSTVTTRREEMSTTKAKVPTTSPPEPEPLSAGALAGIVVGSIVGAAVIAGGVGYALYRYKRGKDGAEFSPGNRGNSMKMKQNDYE